jgi:hypothetical protein
MRVTSRAGAGMSEPPRHHVLPKEFREWLPQAGEEGESVAPQEAVSWAGCSMTSPRSSGISSILTPEIER